MHALSFWPTINLFILSLPSLSYILPPSLFSHLDILKDKILDPFTAWALLAMALMASAKTKNTWIFKVCILINILILFLTMQIFFDLDLVQINGLNLQQLMNTNWITPRLYSANLIILSIILINFKYLNKHNILVLHTALLLNFLISNLGIFYYIINQCYHQELVVGTHPSIVYNAYYILLNILIYQNLKTKIIKKNLIAKDKLAMFLGLSACFLNILLFFFLKSENEINIKRLALDKMNMSQELLSHDLKHRIKALERMQKRCNVDSCNNSSWQLDSLQYCLDMPGFYVIEWINPDFIIDKASKNLDYNVQYIGKYFPFEESRKNALDFAISHKVTSFTPIIKLRNGNLGFVSISPSFKDNAFQGAILGVIDVKKWISSITDQPYLDNFNISIYQDQDILFQNIDILTSATNKFVVSKEFNNMGLAWTIKVWPNATFFSSDKSTFMSYFILIMGFIGSIGISIITTFFQLQKKQTIFIASRNEKMHKLNQLLKNLQEVDTFEGLLKPLINTMPKIFPEFSGAVYIIHPDSKCFQLMHSWSLIPLGPISPTLAFENCMALNLGKDVEHNLLKQNCLHVTKPANFSLCSPFMAHNEVLGVLQLSSEQDVDYNEILQSDIKNIVESIGLSISNLNLRLELEQQSKIDPLTGLYNRRYFSLCMEKAHVLYQAKEASIHLLMIDIDHFKRINDTYGHSAGDLVINKVADCIKKVVGHDQVFRYGGEEFSALLMNLSNQEAEELARSILILVAELKLQYNTSILPKTTISIGLSHFSEISSLVNQVIERADLALYQAKALGRNQVVSFIN